MAYLDAAVTTQSCPFYNEGEIGFCWDDACDHSPPIPSKVPQYDQEEEEEVPEHPSHYDQEEEEEEEEAPEPPSSSVPDPWSTTTTCSILGRHEKGPSCDETCQVLSASDDDVRFPRDDELYAKKRFRNNARGKTMILGIVKRRKAVKAKNQGEYLRSGPVLRRELIAKRKVERWTLPEWRRYGVIQRSLLGM